MSFEKARIVMRDAKAEKIFSGPSILKGMNPQSNDLPSVKPLCMSLVSTVKLGHTSRHP